MTAFSPLAFRVESVPQDPWVEVSRMARASAPDTEPHITVMKREVTEPLRARPGGVFVDATLGGGGHTEAILEQDPAARVFAFDRDPIALMHATERLRRFGERVCCTHATFSEIGERLDEMGIGLVDGLIADFGVSSIQLDDPERGMSFRAEGPLDMRMDRTRGETAAELIDRVDARGLADLLYYLGEEGRSRSIAKCIKQARDEGRLETTLDLRRAVVRAVGPARHGGIDPATKTFQALRIAVNNELKEIHLVLQFAAKRVCVGGVVAILAFHSLEDRIVKVNFKDRSTWCPLWKKPLEASDEERVLNPRARSAKLRAARRIDDSDPTWREAPAPSSRRMSTVPPPMREWLVDSDDEGGGFES